MRGTVSMWKLASKARRACEILKALLQLGVELSHILCPSIFWGSRFFSRRLRHTIRWAVTWRRGFVNNYLRVINVKINTSAESTLAYLNRNLTAAPDLKLFEVAERKINFVVGSRKGHSRSDI